MRFTTGNTTAIALVLLLVATCWSSAAGGSVCFRSRTADRKCVDPIFTTSSDSNSNCCDSKDAMYYTSNNDAPMHMLVLEAIGLGVDNCTPCRRANVSNLSAACGAGCPTGQTCRVNRNGRAKCVCNESCHTDRMKVCGTDAKTYKNRCDLLRKGCIADRRPTVSYNGSCQIGCRNVKCERKNHTCVLDQYYRAHCISCKALLPCSNKSQHDGPICGADGLQYASSCALRLETCKLGKTIGIAYYGPCIANATCDKVYCREKLCLMDNAGRPRCVSCSACNEDSLRSGGSPKSRRDKMLCGTDLRTYKDYCTLRKQACRTKTFIEVKYPGRCKAIDELQVGSMTPTSQPGDQQNSAAPLCNERELEKYFIKMTDFMTLLRQDLGFNVTFASSRQRLAKDKSIFISSLMKLFKRKWTRVN